MPSLPKRLNYPLLCALLTFTVCILLLRPYGNFPLNDDWQYSWITWNLAKTGHFHVDLSIAPSLVLQAYLGAGVIRLFGFSHLYLRALTWVVSGIFFFAVDRILALLEVRRPVRTAVLVTLCLNPIFLNLAMSFMTELYGLTLGLFGVIAWLKGRLWATEHENGSTSLPLRYALLSGILFGLSFWTRQMIILLLPCLAMATLARAATVDGSRGVRQALRPVLLAGAAAGAFLAAYFHWARATGNLNDNFSTPLGQIISFKPRIYMLAITALGYYMTAFLLPFLATLSFRRPLPRQKAKVAVGVILFAFIGLWYFQGKAPRPAGAASLEHEMFPLIGNVVLDTGVGPFTLADSFYVDEKAYVQRPHWNPAFWWGFTALLTILLPWLIFAVTEIVFRFKRRLKSRAGPDPRDDLRWEVAFFGIVVAPAMMILVTQSFHSVGFDRYYLPGFVCAAIAMGLLVDSQVRTKSLRWMIPWALCLFPIAYFSVAGVHDYFRWNDARWDLVMRYKDRIPYFQFFPGHEARAWLDKTQAPLPEPPDGYRWIIGSAHRDGFQVIESIPVSAWLAKMPDVSLQHKVEQ